MAVKTPSKLNRRARALPSAVLDHCTVCLEEKLYLHAISLLTNSLTAGTDVNAPACIPPPQHLAFMTTLAVHPKLTTGTDEQDRQIAANEALKYLRLVADTVDIRESKLKDAFKFEDNAAGRRASNRAKSRRSETGGSDEEGIETSRIRTPYTALWSRNKDFWAVLGWAFNCSIRHKSRWERWKPWLELTLDVLAADMEATFQTSDDEDRMRSSLMAQYLSTIGDSRNNKRRIMRAVMADGCSKSMGEFGEVWAQETKPPEKKANDDDLRKTQKLDLDNNEYGDYFDNQEEEQSQETKKRATRGSSGKFVKQEHSEDPDDTDVFGTIDQFGGMDSLHLRQRLLAVLTRFSWLAPKLFMSTDELFEVFTEFMRPLPLDVYQQFIMPIKPYMDLPFQAALNEMMFQPLLGLQETTGEITQTDFETKFAPSSATNTSAIDNAKVTLLNESILRALWKADKLQGDLQNLKVQVDNGIKARSSKVEYNGRNLTGKNAELRDHAKAEMDFSAERMQMLVDMLAA